MEHLALALYPTLSYIGRKITNSCIAPMTRQVNEEKSMLGVIYEQ